MLSKPVVGKLVPTALEEVDTTSFEKFGQAFFAALIGRRFVPLGGMHDGGAEGFIEPELYEDEKATHFLQVSKQATWGRKIRGTIERLQNFGRNPKALTYISSHVIPDIDTLEETLSTELNCRITIRDARYIETHINNSEATTAAFDTYLRPSLAYLDGPGKSPIGSATRLQGDRTLAVFLRQEVEQRRGKTELLESVADSLIIWALSDTDPDAGRFMDRDEILTKVESALPSSRQFIRGVIDTRLEVLRSRQGAADRQIRYYTSEKKYCLPYETRELVKQENIEDSALKFGVTAVFESRFRVLASDNELSLIESVVKVCHEALEKIFEHQGLLVARFAQNSDEDDEGEELYRDVSEVVARVLDESPDVEERVAIRRLSLGVLRGTFYDATDEERLYLQKLSQTYVLLLLLKNEPRIVEYFRYLSSNFILYVGTDFLVRALSEHYLSPENQTNRNLFELLRKAGATLVLTEKSVEELASHLRRQIFEFQNAYEHLESRIQLDWVQYIDRILIRAYFYSRLAPLAGGLKPPSGWRSYIGQFAAYEDIRNERGQESLAQYLINKFGFVYETADEMHEGISPENIEELKIRILKVREGLGRGGRDKADILAYNDALQALRVYRRRYVQSEASPGNPFGFRTWWLTEDAGVRRASAELVLKHHGQRFMMRPEFLLNFISFAPSAREVVDSYRQVFPTALGIRLSNRMQAHTFREVMVKANEVWSVDEARAGAMMTECVNALKGDTVKVYEHKWREEI